MQCSCKKVGVISPEHGEAVAKNVAKIKQVLTQSVITAVYD